MAQGLLSMLVRVFKIISSLLFLAGVGMILVSCGGPVGGDSKSPVFLEVEGTSLFGLAVDVYTPGVIGRVTDDFFDLTIQSNYKGEGGNTSIITTFADVIIQEYRVTYFRADGSQNVPEPFTLPCTISVPAGLSAAIRPLVLRREAKLESPLKDLAFGGGEGHILFNAIIEFFGKDLIGNHVSARYVLILDASDTF